jgi:hypothetical protein
MPAAQGQLVADFASTIPQYAAKTDRSQQLDTRTLHVF